MQGWKISQIVASAVHELYKSVVILVVVNVHEQRLYTEYRTVHSFNQFPLLLRAID